ncbi:MAG: RNA polymerase sigma factor [Nannocystales bacterium]
MSQHNEQPIRPPREARERFDVLLRPHDELLRAYVRRLIGHAADAEDLVQATTLKAFERFATLRDEGAFRGWLLTIATRTCLDHLRKQERWRPYSQRYLEEECEADDERRQQVVDATRDPGFAFDVREHVSFCFSCVGRSLVPTRAAAIVLREVVGLTNKEAANILSLSESVFRGELSKGRRAMEATFDGLCSLINKDGVCRQCASFREVMPAARRGPALPVLNDRGDPWQARLTLVRATPFANGISAGLHELLFSMLKTLEAEHGP